MKQNENPAFPPRGDKSALTKWLAAEFKGGIRTRSSAFPIVDPLDEFLRKYLAQELSEDQKRRYPRMLLATNLNPETSGGNPIEWTDVETSSEENNDQPVIYTSKAYQVTAITFRRYYDHTLMARAIIESDEILLRAVNANLRETFRDSARLAPSGLTEYLSGNPSGPDGNVLNLELLHTEGTGSAKPRWGTPEARKSIVEAMETAYEFAAGNQWHSNHTTAGVAVVPIQIASEIRRYLTQDVPQLSPLTRVDSVNRLGKVMWLNGWEIVTDVTEASPNNPDAACTDGWANIDFLHPEKRSVAYTLSTRNVQEQCPWQHTLNGHSAVQGASRHLYQVRIRICDN